MYHHKVSNFTMELPTSLSLLSIFILLHPYSILAIGSSTVNNHKAPANPDFIRTSCSTTLYPDVCFTSLSGYSSAVQNDTGKLAKAAISVSLKNVHRMSRYLSNISTHAYSVAEMPVLKDCSSVFSDAVDQIRDSFKQMNTIGKGTGSVKFQLSNVQTWMSSALTNEETCTDGFGDVQDIKLKSDIFAKAEKVKKVTSNALALVNSYVSTVHAA